MTNIKPEGRVALITGAARGIGAATAVALARQGIASVLAVRTPEAAQGAADAVGKLGIACQIQTCDVADYTSVKHCIDNTLNSWGRLDIVINNAGQVEPQEPLAQTDPAEWERAISVNLVGPYNVIHAALPELLQRQGTIINVSTGAAHMPHDGWSAYCCSKAGLYMLSRSVLNEYGKQGLAVYSLQPGLTATEMQVRVRSVGINQISRVPHEKLAPPELPASVIAWLAATVPRDLMGSDLTTADSALLERTRSAV